MAHGLKGTPGVVVTCEHASNHLPARARGLGLTSRLLEHHISWDPGARTISRTLARALHAPVVFGRINRLYVDLNRSLDNHKLMARNSFGYPIPGNTEIAPEEFEERVEAFWVPFRTESRRHMDEAVRRHGSVIHLSMHSFTPEPEGRPPRPFDGGVLYDPKRPLEGAFAGQLVRELRTRGVDMWRNRPYYGDGDGHTTLLRGIYRPEQYIGLYIEFSQRLTNDEPTCRQLGRTLAEALQAVLGRD